MSLRPFPLIKLVLLFLPLGCFAESLLVNSGHVGIINDLKYSKTYDLLFSVGDDGVVKIWDVENSSIANNIKVSFYPILKIALHPEKPLMAVIVKDRAGFLRLEMWDWNESNRIFSTELKEIPLFLGFSNRGTYLIYTLAEFDSVRFIDTDSGPQKIQMSTPSGIVSFVASSTNEHTFMTYQPVGKITYWNAKTGVASVNLTTLSGVEDISISSDKRFMIGRYRNKFVLINLLSGKLEATVDTSLKSIPVVSEDFPEMIILEKDKINSSGTAVVRRLHVNRGLSERWSEDIQLNGIFTAATYGKSSLFIADSTGIIKLPPFGGASTFASNKLLLSPEIAFLKDRLLIATENALMMVKSDLLNDILANNSENQNNIFSVPSEYNPFESEFGIPGSLSRLSYFSNKKKDINSTYSTIFPKPYYGIIGITPLAYSEYQNIDNLSQKENLFLLWNTEGTAGKLGVLDVDSGIFEEKVKELDYPVEQIVIVDNKLIVLERGGRILFYYINQLFMESGDNLMEPFRIYYVPGARKILYFEDRMVTILDSISDINVPLLEINLVTGETLPLKGDSFIIYDIARFKHNKFITLNLKKTQLDTITQIELYDQDGLISPVVLDSFFGEDLHASLISSNGFEEVYSSLGEGSIKSWDGDILVEFEKSFFQTRKMISLDDHLVAINTDGSFSVWDKTSKNLLYDIYVFEDKEWVVLDENRVLRSSFFGRNHLRTKFKLNN